MNPKDKDSNTLFEKVRKQFIGLDTEYTLATGETERRIYLDSTATTLMMEAAHEVLERFYHHYGNTHSLLHFDAKIASREYHWLMSGYSILFMPTVILTLLSLLEAVQRLE